MKKSLTFVGALFWASTALAQVNVVPQVGVTTAWRCGTGLLEFQRGVGFVGCSEWNIDLD